VRECVVHPDDAIAKSCEEMKQADIHDLALLLLRALTLERGMTPQIKLPAPFDRIVLNGISGSWGLAEIELALNPPVVKPAQPLAPLATRPLVPPSVMASLPAQRQAALNFEGGDPAAATAPAPAMKVRRVRSAVQPAPKSKQFWLGCLGAAAVLLLLCWLIFRGKPTSAPVVAPAASTAIPTINDAPTPKPSASAPSVAAKNVVHTPVATARTQAGWHVIAYTYNREDQAWKKVATIRNSHPALSPEVFSPGGRAPFLVALGGAMSETEAQAMRNRARRDGMPGDTFIKRYEVR
jgi:hypothetical protein